MRTSCFAPRLHMPRRLVAPPSSLPPQRKLEQAAECYEQALKMKLEVLGTGHRFAGARRAAGAGRCSGARPGARSGEPEHAAGLCCLAQAGPSAHIEAIVLTAYHLLRACCAPQRAAIPPSAPAPPHSAHALASLGF